MLRRQASCDPKSTELAAARPPRAARVRGVLLDALEARRLLAFGVTATSTTLTIDNGADLKFTVLSGGTLSSTIHLGDITSIKYKGQELLASYAQTSRYSHYEQGLGSITTISY